MAPIERNPIDAASTKVASEKQKYFVETELIRTVLAKQAVATVFETFEPTSVQLPMPIISILSMNSFLSSSSISFLLYAKTISSNGNNASYKHLLSDM